MAIPIFDDKEFQSLDYAQKRQIATNYFNRELADDEFRKLDSSTQNRIIGNYLKDNIGEAKRTWGEATTDTLKSAAAGVNSVVQMGGDLYGLATGNTDNAASKLGKEGSEYWKNSQSDAIKQQRADQQAFIDAGKGEGDKFWRTITSTATNPALLSDFIAEQAPQFVVGGVAGRGVGLGAKALGAGAKTAGRAATAGAIGAESAMQGAQVGGQTYEQLMQLDDGVWAQNKDFQNLVGQGMSPDEAKHNIALSISRKAGAVGGALTVGTQFLPGGQAVERVLAGATREGTEGGIKGALKSGAKAFLGEGIGEGIEEGGGQVAQNYGVQQVDPNQSLMQGVGQSTAQGALLGGLMGGTTGAIEGSRKSMKELVDEKKAQMSVPTEPNVGAATKGMETASNNLNQSYDLGFNRASETATEPQVFPQDTTDKIKANETDLGKAPYEITAEQELAGAEKGLQYLKDNGATPEALASQQAKVDALKQKTAQNLSNEVVKNEAQQEVQQQTPMETTQPKAENEAPLFSKEPIDRQVNLTEWHKDSSPITKNEDGTPKVFYHGTKGDFDTFNSDLGDKKVKLNVLGKGIYLTEKADRASSYAKESYGSNVMPVYVKANKLLDTNSLNIIPKDKMQSVLGVESSMPESRILEYLKSNKYKAEERTKILNELGYDGVRENNTVMVFNPNQIKSVYNKGTFDESNPNILESKSNRTNSGATLEQAEAQARKLLGDKYDKHKAEGLTIVQSYKDLPADIRKQSEAESVNLSGKSRGIFNPKDGKSYIIADTMGEHEVQSVVLHELLHKAINDVVVKKSNEAGYRVKRLEAIMGSQYKPLVRRLEELKKMGDKKVLRAYKQAKNAGTEEAHMTEEVMAYLLQHYSMDDKPMLRQLIDDFIRAVRDFVNRVAVRMGVDPKWLNSKLDADGIAEILRNYAINSEQSMGEGSPMMSKQEPSNVMFSKESVVENAVDKRNSVKQWLKDKYTDTRDTLGINVLLKTINQNQKAELFEKIAPEYSKYMDIVSLKSGEANRISRTSAEIAESIRKWAMKNKDEADSVFKLMGETTISGFDPTIGYEEQSKKVKAFNTFIEKSLPEMDKIDTNLFTQAEYNKVKAKYDALSDGAKEVYNRTKEHYKNLGDMMFKALQDKIASQGLPEEVSKKIIDRLRMEYESRRLSGPYFPLARFGDYSVRGVDKNGKPSFEMFESPSERDKRAKEMAEQGYTDIKLSANIDEKYNLGADTAFMSDLFKELESNGVDKEVTDNVYQLYLRYLPNMSARKQFIHRKGIQGYSDDGLRVFADKSFHLARQIANTRHLWKMEAEMNNLKDRVKETGDPKLKAIYEDMVDTHEHIVNPKHNAIAQALSSFGFYWYLSSPSSGLVNVSQLPLVVFPSLAGKYGVGRAGHAMAKAAFDIKGAVVDQFGKDFKNKDTSKSFDHLPKDEQEAIKHFIENGDADVTMAHDLAGLADNYGAWNYGALTTIQRVASIPQHYTEVFNRLTTLLATYRMARDSGEVDPIKVASKINKQTNFDYTNEARAWWMRNPSAKVVTQFKNYAVHLTYFLLRNTVNSLRGDKEAMRTMATLLVTTALISGVKGLPLQPLMLIMGLGGADAPDDELYAWLKENFGENADVMWRGVVNKLTGMDIGGRVGMNDLFIKDPKDELEGTKLLQYYLEQVAGPTYSTLSSFARGLGELGKEHYLKTAEAFSPKPIRDLLQTYRFANEGARDNSFKPIIQDFTAKELAAKSIGFSPERLSSEYDSNARQKRAQERVDQERKEILSTLREADFRGNKELWDKTMEKVQEFNTKYPEVAIKGKSINTTLKNYRKGISDAEQDLDEPKKYRSITDKYK